MNEVIAIRADGNSEIGFGHLMRTQALARQLEKRGARVIFLTKNPENVKGCLVEPISLKAKGAEEDRVVEQILKSCRAEMLIIDSYAYQQVRLDRMAGLDLLSVYIDDMNRHPFNTDYVVNGNLYAPRMDYQGRAKCLLGNEYLMIREEFCGLPPRKVSKRVENVLISFGAADMKNITPRILRLLRDYEQFERLQWHIIIGPVFRNSKEIEQIVDNSPNSVLYYNPNIKKLMEFCDISISAAGSTVYELAACGVPSVIIIAGKDQVLLAQEAQCQGIAINLGWYNAVNQSNLFVCLDELIGNYALRKKLSTKGYTMINSREAGKVAEVLLEILRRR